jgi:hypothetical protein
MLCCKCANLPAAGGHAPGGQHAFSHSGHAVSDLLQRLALADAQSHRAVAAEVAYSTTSELRLASVPQERAALVDSMQITESKAAARGPVQVRTRSPMPARPGIVSGWAPAATACEQATSRVMRAVAAMQQGHSDTLASTQHDETKHQACHLSEAAGDERCAAVVAEPQAIADAAGNGQHILQRTPQLHTCVFGGSKVKQQAATAHSNGT